MHLIKQMVVVTSMLIKFTKMITIKVSNDYDQSYNVITKKQQYGNINYSSGTSVYKLQ